jgi:enamine deaminase RidA (YjgF/YER057c/UK114 family)
VPAREDRAVDLFRGTPYEYFAVAPEGSLVFTAGACPLDAEGRVVAVGDHEEQARRALANLQAALAEAGSDFKHVLKSTVYAVTTDPAELIRTWKVVEETFAPAKPPSTLLGVSLLGYPDQLVEIEAVAVVPRTRPRG